MRYTASSIRYARTMARHDVATPLQDSSDRTGTDTSYPFLGAPGAQRVNQVEATPPTLTMSPTPVASVVAVVAHGVRSMRVAGANAGRKDGHGDPSV